MKLRVKVTVEGRVQGVAYRRATQEQAVRLGVTGWVRNLPDGRVDGCFEGDEQDVHTLIAWCRQGPMNSRVDRIDLENQTYLGEFSDFRILA